MSFAHLLQSAALGFVRSEFESALVVMAKRHADGWPDWLPRPPPPPAAPPPPPPPPPLPAIAKPRGSLAREASVPAAKYMPARAADMPVVGRKHQVPLNVRRALANEMGKGRGTARGGGLHFDSDFSSMHKLSIVDCTIVNCHLHILPLPHAPLRGKRLRQKLARTWRTSR